MRSALLSATAALVLPGLAGAADYEVDPDHSVVQFGVKHMMISTVRGTFTRFTGTVRLDDQDPARSRFEARIDAASVDTRSEKRDAHLRSADFFDAANHPGITFVSTRTARVAPGRYRVTGDLTMRGVTKPVVLEVEAPPAELKDPYGNVKRGVVATGKVNRKDFGLNWNQALEAGGVLVGDEVQIALDIQLTRKSAETASR